MLKLQTPNGDNRVLLHSCCAPCSSAIIECMLANDIRPTVFYCIPNIYPQEEYEIRLECFTLRLTETARYASGHGFSLFTTTLASSRWKSLDQINQAGRRAAALYPGTQFWEQNWRKGGLQERRNQLLREYAFYNQQYCGCEFSMRRLEKATPIAPPLPDNNL